MSIEKEDFVHFIDGSAEERHSRCVKTANDVEFTRENKVMNNKGLIVIQGTYHLSLNNGTPGVVGKLLRDTQQMFTTFSIMDAGKFATQLLLNAREIDKEANLVSSSLYGYQHYYGVTGAGGYIGNIKVVYNTINGSRMDKNILNGSVLDLVEFTTPASKIKNYVGKVIRFDYSGGTSKGVKVIRLTSVEGVAPNLLLKGTDLVKNAPRSYNLPKVNGDIEVIS